jgi:hypothetical protein
MGLDVSVLPDGLGLSLVSREMKPIPNTIATSTAMIPRQPRNFPNIHPADAPAAAPKATFAVWAGFMLFMPGPNDCGAAW